MIKNKISSECAGIHFWFYWEQRGTKIWATLHLGDDHNFKQKSKDLTQQELDSILKMIRDIPINEDHLYPKFTAEWEQARHNRYKYRWEVFMPMVESFFAEDWTKLT